ncbi:TIGR01777 family oxidoreductase [Amycolatopsis acidiphila]|uniref:TIGR01777 family protein n=1 Tax=Amycolatopsis acidiphila TaxID=715473 RepID=A0A557ZT04_9PSEU|nr:TIGR01777 family oxidoreductase [Amycolatopsis acidiphila]TVT15151.1 TIGR01777 family protein [Amycolatopsis acidiphila]UIJ58471.1 TIGR01777 family oxidoreductase [Amycolatopsis acidiphila]GHG77334.1 multidrug MFS transporter [Amycolatopsis acidiphila]
MRVLVAGSRGLIGNALVEALHEAGHEVRRLVRGNGEYSWDPPAGRIDDTALKGVDAVVNLCGASLVTRWSAARKQMIADSRIEPTEVLAEAVAEQRVPTLINASAVGFYGDRGADVLDETAPRGDGFLAHLCEAWEAATAPAKRAGARVAHLRTGLVLSRRGGLLGPLKPLFRLGLGGRLGDGRQYMPWISERDEVGAIRFLLEHETLAGPVNLAGPEPVTNAEFTRAFGRVVRRPAPWWVPGAALELALGEAADEMALVSQRAVPAVLQEAGYTFAHSTVDTALAAAR